MAKVDSKVEQVASDIFETEWLKHIATTGIDESFVAQLEALVFDGDEETIVAYIHSIARGAFLDGFLYAHDGSPLREDRGLCGNEQGSPDPSI